MQSRMAWACILRKCPRALKGVAAMKARKPKNHEPSLRDKLSQNFLRAFESDFETHGVDVIEQLREKSPEKYAKIASKLIATTEPKADGFEQCKDMESIGRRLLRSVGLEDEGAATPAMVQAALDAQDRLISELAKIIEDGMH